MKTTFLNYEIETGEKIYNNQTWFIARCYKIAPKSKLGFKQEFAYRFKTMQEATQYIDKFMSEVKERIERNEREKQLKKEAKKGAVNPFKVGDILYDSWGYDQTNIDFYQITKVNGMQIEMRELSQELTQSDGLSSMAGYVTPRKGDFISEPIKKIVQVMTSYNSQTQSYKASCYIPSKHGWISLWDGNKKYCSWYA